MEEIIADFTGVKPATIPSKPLYLADKSALQNRGKLKLYSKGLGKK